MFKLKTIKKNHEIIREFCRLYRTEITEYQGDLSEGLGNMSKKDYIKFSDELSFEEFCGMNYTMLCHPEGIKLYKKVLDGKMTIKEFYDMMRESAGVIVDLLDDAEK